MHKYPCRVFTASALLSSNGQTNYVVVNLALPGCFSVFICVAITDKNGKKSFGNAEFVVTRGCHSHSYCTTIFDRGQNENQRSTRNIR